MFDITPSSIFFILSDLKCLHIYLYCNHGKNIPIPIRIINRHGNNGLGRNSHHKTKNIIASVYLITLGVLLIFKKT